MNSEIKRVSSLAITLAFLAYGLLRLVVGLGMVGQAMGIIDIVDFHEPIADVDRFLAEKRDEAFIPFSPVGYLCYIVLMGFTLTVGAIGVLLKRNFGLVLVGAFLLLWLALFVNFQTINQKIYQAAIFGVMYAALAWLENRLRETG